MRRVLAAYLGLGLLLAPIPLLNVLQAESSAVVALVAFFVSGWAAVEAFGTEHDSLGRVLARQEAALLVPLGLLTLAQLWAPNCTFGQGLLFYVLFPGVTVVLAVSVAYAVQGMGLSRPGFVVGAIGGLLVLGGPLYDLGLHPQFYTYNHVFGGILGPIYDEQLAVRPGLFVFRGLTLLWALAAVLVGRRLRGRGRRWPVLMCALAIGGLYLFSVPLGMNTSAGHLQAQLGGHTRTPHFDLYYDSERVNESTAEDLAQDHEAQYDWIRRRLDVEGDGPRIQSYIYPNPDVKGRLTGARTTSITPVWLSTPQVHLLQRRVSQSLGHELAHVVSRPYGLPGLRASWAPGLVEGWAVAVEPPSTEPSPDDLVRTAIHSDTTTSVIAAARAVEDRLSPWGFWTGRGAVSYATMGSFVQYLLDRGGPDKLKRVYAWGNFEAVYGHSLQVLAEGWAADLRRASSVARDAHDLVTRRFTRPSLFETECPHYVPPARRHLQEARRAARRRDSTQMINHLTQALSLQPRFAAAHERLARIRLARGQPDAVRRQLDTLAAEHRTVGIHVALADAQVLEGEVEAGRRSYADARARTPTQGHDLRARLMLREATADRPSVVRVLVSADSAETQAQRLGALENPDPSVEAWRGLRWMEARQYGEALSVWRENETPVSPERPRGWHRTWTLQKRAWAAEAALRGGNFTAARSWAVRAARLARLLGDRGRVAVFNWWAARAERNANTAVLPTPEGGSSLAETVERSSRRVPMRLNHAPGLLVEGDDWKRGTKSYDLTAVPLSHGSCAL